MPSSSKRGAPAQPSGVGKRGRGKGEGAGEGAGEDGGLETTVAGTQIHPDIEVVDTQVEQHCALHAVNNLLGDIVVRFDYPNRKQALLKWQEEEDEDEEEEEYRILNAAYILLSDAEALRQNSVLNFSGSAVTKCVACAAQIGRPRCFGCTRAFMSKDLRTEVLSSATASARKAAAEALKNKGPAGTLSTDEIVEAAASAAVTRALYEVTSQTKVHSVNVLLDGSEGSAAAAAAAQSGSRRAGAAASSAMAEASDAPGYRPLAHADGNVSDAGVCRVLESLGLFYQRRGARVAHKPWNSQIFTSTALKTCQAEAHGFLGVIVYKSSNHYIAFKYNGGAGDKGRYVFLDSMDRPASKEDLGPEKTYCNGGIYTPVQVFKWVNRHSWRPDASEVNGKASGMVWIVATRRVPDIAVRETDKGISKTQRQAEEARKERLGSKGSGGGGGLKGSGGGRAGASRGELEGGCGSDWIDHTAFDIDEHMLAALGI